MYQSNMVFDVLLLLPEVGGPTSACDVLTGELLVENNLDAPGGDRTDGFWSRL